jgi:hypothetical protein
LQKLRTTKNLPGWTVIKEIAERALKAFCGNAHASGIRLSSRRSCLHDVELMALWKTTGPEGLHKDSQPIDDGTLARMFSPTPGPTGLYTLPKVPSNSAQAVAQSTFGIRINDASKINADNWVKKINSSDGLDDYFKPQIQSKDPMIYLKNPKNFIVPRNVIEKVWLKDWLSAFTGGDWEMTTGFLDISADNSKGPVITFVHTPDLSSGDSIDGFTKHTMTGTFHALADVSIEMGITLTDGATLVSKRKKLIVIASRIALSLGGKSAKPFVLDDTELVSTWFHEIACHAGENTEGIPDIHGDAHVELCAKDIDAMFGPSKVVTQVFGEIDSFFKSSAPSKPGAPSKKPGSP